MKAFVICRLPKAGLGNQLFPLMHARLFASLNGLELIVTGYHQLKLGPYLRREKSKRAYAGYFTFQRSVFGEMAERIKCFFICKSHTPVFEPGISILDKHAVEGKVFIFENLPTYHDYFTHLRSYRNEVRQLLEELLSNWVIKRLDELTPPVIAVHIRMGDFRKLKAGEEFKGGHVRTPLEYFAETIKGIRLLAGKDLPVGLFSDGYPDELKEITDMPNVSLIEGNPDIVDLLLLSRGKVIITTTGSTFSYWAGFLSDAPVILHPDHIYQPFRPASVNSLYYEGAFDIQHPDNLLAKNIQQLSAH